MQPASEKCSYLEALSCKEDSLKENRLCFNQNQDTLEVSILLKFWMLESRTEQD